MSETYNPETELFERIETLTVEAHQLALKRDRTTDEADREMLKRQLHEVERQIEQLKRRLRG